MSQLTLKNLPILLEHFGNSGMLIRDSIDGNYIHPLEPKPFLNWRYINTNTVADDECAYWSTLMDLFRKSEGASFIPLHCMNCWKVVVRPLTVVQLITLLKYMEQSGRRCKCGCELRPEVCWNYGGYFYNLTKEDGLDCLDAVYNDLKPVLFPDVPDEMMDEFIFLKRSCTEYEQEFGDSSKWGRILGQESIEKYIREHVKAFRIAPEQSDRVKAETVGEWVKRAYSIRDLTYLEITGGKSLHKPYHKYKRDKVRV